MAAPIITATAYNFALSSLGNFEGVITPTYHQAVRNGVGASTITLLNTSANRTLLGNANLYLIHVHYTTPAGNSRALAQVVFTSAEMKEQINMAADRIEITGPDMMIEWQKRRMDSAVISFGYGDPRVGDSPLVSGVLSESACYINNPTGVSIDAQHFERWVFETDNTTGGKTQAQINASASEGTGSGALLVTFDTNYFGEDTRWSNGLPDTGSSKNYSLYSFEVTDDDFTQLFHYSELDDDGWDIVSSAGGASVTGTTDGTYSSAYYDSALSRLQFMALQDGGTFYMPMVTPTREVVYKTSAPASGITLSNDGTTGSTRGHIVGGVHQQPAITRYTRMKVVGPGTGVGALKLIAGQAEIEALPEYPIAPVAVDWQRSILKVTDWETVARSDSPVVTFPELQALNDYDDSYAAVAVELYKAGVQKLLGQNPSYDYATVNAYVLGYDLYPYHSLTVDYTDRDLSGTWYVDRIRRNLTNSGLVLCNLTLMSNDQAAAYLTPQEKIVDFHRATWEVQQSTNSTGSTGGTFSGGGTGGGSGSGMVQHDINGGWHSGFPLDWSNVDAASGDLADLGTRAHSSLTGINDNDHHEPVTLQTNSGLDLSGQAIKMKTPSSLSHSSSNEATESTHRHAITASSDVKTSPAASLLKSDSGGGLKLNNLIAEDITADRLIVEAFVADVNMVQAGTEDIANSLGVLSRPFTVPGSISGTATIYFYDLIGGTANFSLVTGDENITMRAVDRTGGGLNTYEVWGELDRTSYNDEGGGEQSWTFTLVDGDTSVVIPEGSLAVGLSYDGGNPYRIRSTTTKSGAPYIELAEWETNPYTDANWTQLVSLNANGLNISATAEAEFNYEGASALTFLDPNGDSLGGMVGGFEYDGGTNVGIGYLRIKAEVEGASDDPELRLFSQETGGTGSSIALIADSISNVADVIYFTVNGTSAYLRVPLKTPLLNTAYNGDDTITTASGEITLDAQDWGVPGAATEISIRVRCKFNGASNANLLEFYPTATSRGYVMVYEPNDAQWASGSGTIPLSLAGQFHAKASGNNATSVEIIVTGYAI